jgi:hypothetical protein
MVRIRLDSRPPAPPTRRRKTATWRPERWTVGLLASALAVQAGGPGCTTLGPMPGMTMASPIPQSRTGVELQAALVPGYYLSDSVKADGNVGTAIAQGAAFFEPGTLLSDADAAPSLRGLGFGLRLVGNDGDHYVEPMLRYRRHLDAEERVAFALVGYGSATSAASNGASYEMTRAGLEFGVDIRATPRSRWIELHMTGGAALTGLWGSGRYCLDAESQLGRDCDSAAGEQAGATARVGAALPSIFVGSYVTALRELGFLHGVRFGMVLAGGVLPELRPQEELDHRAWFSWGLELSVGFGAGGGDDGGG